MLSLYYVVCEYRLRKTYAVFVFASLEVLVGHV